MEKIYYIKQDEVMEKMSEIILCFRELTRKEPYLIEFFNGDNRFSNVIFAEAYLAGMDLRNKQRENGNLDGNIEKSPYSKEQERLINEYTRLKAEYERLESKIEKDTDLEM